MNPKMIRPYRKRNLESSTPDRALNKGGTPSTTHFPINGLLFP
jgi:hypothetical protein